jgi:hypothetical protein
MDKDNPTSNTDPPDLNQSAIQSSLTQSTILDTDTIQSSLTQSIHPFSPQMSEIYNTQTTDSSATLG